MLKFAGQNIVIVSATDINTSVMGEKWFIQKNFLSADEIIDGKTIITPVYTVIHSKDFRIQVLNNQIAIFIEKLENDSELTGKAISLARKIIESKALNSVMSMGTNFSYITDRMENIEEMTTKLSFNPSNKFHQHIKGNDKKRFGSYTSFDFLDARLRIDIKPEYSIESKIEYSEVLIAQFNFHKNFNEENSTIEAFDFLENFEAFKNYSDETVDIINETIK
jgi:hypothetical protein